jgi:hypothetical protein
MRNVVLMLIPGIPTALPRLAAVLLAGTLLEIALIEVFVEQLLFLDEALPSHQDIHQPRIPILVLDFLETRFKSGKDSLD